MTRQDFTKKDSGFTLAEMLVSVALFSIVVTVSMGALLTVLNANRKAQALQTVMNNLNFALEQMSRDIRVGTNYSCGATGHPNDCSSGSLGYTSHDGKSVVYELGTTPATASQIVRSLDGGATFQAVTAPDITIQGLRFVVTGSSPGDQVQPKVLFALQGYTGVTDPGHPQDKTYFNLQTTVSSRRLDR